MGKCDFVLENVDWLAQLRRALKVEDCFFQGNQLPLFGSPPTWRAVSMLTPRWGFLGDWTNLFSVGYLLPASPPLHLPECLPLLLQPFILLDGMDPVFVPHHLDKSWGRRGGFLTMFFWLTQRRERREWGKECVHLWLYTFTCVPEKSLPWKGDSWGVLCCLFSGKLCDIYWWPVTSLFQQKLCKENGSEGFGQNADRISCLSESTYGR